MRQRTRAIAALVALVMAISGASVSYARRPDALAALQPMWIADTAGAVALFYPPARTRLLVGDAPGPLINALRRTGFQIVEDPVAGTMGSKFSVQAVALPDGTFLIVRVGQNALSSLWGPTGRLTDWSIGTYNRGAAHHAKGSK